MRNAENASTCAVLDSNKVTVTIAMHTKSVCNADSVTDRRLERRYMIIIVADRLPACSMLYR
jgi:hypothetical protein